MLYQHIAITVIPKVNQISARRGLGHKSGKAERHSMYAVLRDTALSLVELLSEHFPARFNSELLIGVKIAAFMP